MEETIVKISVRNLVEFILRSGDIDNRTTGSMEKDAMLMGGRIHRNIQKKMGENYRAEVPLKIRVPCDGFFLDIEGRADGIQNDGEMAVIDEIKGIVRKLEHLEAPVPVHLAQAKCYAYIYAEREQVEMIGVQMTYCQMETEEIRRFQHIYTYSELESWFKELVRAYEKWARFQIEWKKIRNESVRKVEFPFPYREGQRELVASVYRTILRKKKLFIQAPTGVGKTISTVFPAVRAVGEGLGDKIFYLTAKTITRTVAENAFDILKERGLKYKIVTLTAKEKICFCEEADCNPDACIYAKGHYDRVNDAVYDLIISSGEWNRERLEEQARKYRICPFEMSLDAAVWADAVICDYNYVFDPNAHLRRFFSEGGKEEYIFLVDEAHNLVERGREMYSAALYKEELMELRKLTMQEAPRLGKMLMEVNRQFLALKRECESWNELKSVSHIVLKLMNIMGEMEKTLEEWRDNETRTALLEGYFRIRDFLNIHEMLDENYVIYAELQGDGRFCVKLFCVNPAENLQRFLNQGNSTVFFSATLLPIQYYKKLLSTETDDYAVYARSSFPQQNRLLLVGTDVSTRYTVRGKEMYRRFAKYIETMVCGKQGNYMAFFPSYRFLQEVYECFMPFLETHTGYTCICQKQNMGEKDREEFLKAFEQEQDESVIAFCVLGGIFSEGIDLTDDRLIGAAVAGTGIPQVCSERELLKKYFDERGMHGFEYAYLYPGMNKVLQSAGRVIRTEKDRGVIMLLDSRFQDSRCRSVFPREWENCIQGRLEDMEQQLWNFWKKNSQEDFLEEI